MDLLREEAALMLLSLLQIALSAIFALVLFTQSRRQLWQVATGMLLTGCIVALWCYLGNITTWILQRPSDWFLVPPVGFGMLGLISGSAFRTTVHVSGTPSASNGARVVIAIVMGLAVVGMHYTSLLVHLSFDTFCVELSCNPEIALLCLLTLLLLLSVALFHPSLM